MPERAKSQPKRKFWNTDKRTNKGGSFELSGKPRPIVFLIATQWMADTYEEMLDFEVGGVMLQQLLQILPEQPTDNQSHIEKLDRQLKANNSNTKSFHMYFADFETKCRELVIASSPSN